MIEFDKNEFLKPQIYSTLDEYETRCNVTKEIVNDIKKLQKENKILKENAENNDKVVDKVNWENQLLKKEIHQLKEQLESSEKARKEAIEFIKSKEYVIDFSTFGYELNNYEIFKLKNILDIDKGE